MDSADDRRVVMRKLRVELGTSSSDDSDREEDEAQEAVAAEASLPAWSPRTVAGAGAGSNRRRLLSKQLSMKETTREAKWEKRRRQILRRGSMASVVREDDDDHAAAGRQAGATKPSNHGGGGRGEGRRRPALERVRSERDARCLTDGDLDELRASFELGFGFDEGTGGAHLRDTLPALDFYFAVNRQLSDPKLRTLAPSPTSTLSPVSSSSTLPDTPSSCSPSPHAGGGAAADAWKIFAPGDNPQLIKTRLRHWAQVVACSVKHGR
ncbi:hypothetical protein ACP70R_022104 [Stipagrostis hirtigluma subsp. patula]